MKRLQRVHLVSDIDKWFWLAGGVVDSSRNEVPISKSCRIARCWSFLCQETLALVRFRPSGKVTRTDGIFAKNFSTRNCTEYLPKCRVF